MLSIDTILTETLKPITLQDDDIPIEPPSSTASSHTNAPDETMQSETVNSTVLTSFNGLVAEAFLSSISIPPPSLASTLILPPLRPNHRPPHRLRPLTHRNPLFLLSMPPKPRVTFHFVRHGLAEHNIAFISNMQIAALIPDPPLTSRGQQQCLMLLKSFPHLKNITHILVSPLTRTLETLLLGFAPLLEAPRSLEAIAWPELRERGFAPCNIGQKLGEVKRRVEGKGVDVSLLKEGWELDGKEETGLNSIMVVKERVRRVKEGLMELGNQALRGEEGVWKGIKVGRVNKKGDVDVLVVGHGAFLSRLTGNKDDNSYGNAKFRSFMFATKEQVQNGADPMDLLEMNKSIFTFQYKTPDRKDFEKMKVLN